MELFDTHAHFEGTAEGASALIARARAAGVSRIMAVGGSVALNDGVGRAFRAGKAQGGIFRALGYDRDQAGLDLPAIDFAGVSAVGEIGLDYFYEGAPHPAQRDLFASSLACARAHNLPVVIHTRAADDDTLGVLREVPSRGIIHSFTGSRAFCRKLLDLGFYISISGIVTFKSADNVREVARYIPDDRLLIETDSPYLAPVPKRGKPNESANLVHTAKFLAALRETPLEIFAAMTTANGLAVLGA